MRSHFSLSSRCFVNTNLNSGYTVGGIALGTVLTVSKRVNHELSKIPVDSILLIKGEGVEGDVHRGVTVQHQLGVKEDPTQPNLRQVHLIQHELIQELQEKGFDVKHATMGENITTSGIELLPLPTGTILNIGSEVKIELTGLRVPCAQLNKYQKGLAVAVLDQDENGNTVSRIGIMGIILKGGLVKADDKIEVFLPPEPHKPLERV